ncbi:uroporphyrinogen-III C-methyltransferase [Pseudoalteromonas luteoviolacea]|uniref:uroporphyrinogen-III C-methyltransferase n=1 Tax=Pseudoalteromonas luteoviolacea TaxID=43657 RepID=UPI001152BBDE|nr:uroporphyrinogen-III C-methyltransferase [Pseudoalteromonas luteoviolacea]TQF72701.1 uroporphyrinogen-III synthase [Pseudoalteromonas luteoviolacea]
MKFAITRPQGKGDELATELAKQGISALCTPVLKLESVEASQAQLVEACDAEIIIFISQDAVLNFAAQLQKAAIPLSTHAQLIAVGQQTADTIVEHFSRNAIVPTQQDSEGLVALSVLQEIAQVRVALVKGRGGRTHIAKTLKSRGALVTMCNVYERCSIHEYSSDWLDHWMREKIDGIVVTSNTAVDAIFNSKQSAHLRWLKARYFVVVSARTAQHLKIQFKITDEQIIVSDGASNESLFKTICKLTSQQGSAMTEKNQQTSTSESKQNMEVAAENIERAPKAKLSKTAVVALLIALTGVGATSGLFYYNQQQDVQRQNSLAALQQQNQQLQTQLSSAISSLNQLQSQWPKQEQLVTEQLARQQAQVAENLQQALSKARQQVGGALSSELRSLARHAEFKALSERDYLGSVLVLKRLQQALAEETGTDALRLAISKDIAKLQAQPKPKTEALYMELAGLLSQVDSVPLKTFEKPTVSEPHSTVLSSDISEWRENIIRSLEKISAEFLTVERHDKPVIDPLLDAQEQQLIRSQLRSYLQQAQTALLDGQMSIYFNAVEGAKDTLNRYFRVEQSAANSMLNTLKTLQRAEFGTSKDLQLATPTALKEWLQ